jgi:ribonucleoside-diphosphate reductase alpha chain
MFDNTTESSNESPVSSSNGETGDFFVPNYDKNNKIKPFGLATFQDSYLLAGETPQDLYLRVARAGSSNHQHMVRLYNYMSDHWFSPATPILSNLGTKRGLPISCFINSVQDSLEDIDAVWHENVWLAARGGGIGTYYGNVRSIGEGIGRVGQTSGIIPFIKVMDTLTTAISQGSLRRGNAAVYLDISHPEIEEFIDIRKPTGGDPRRKTHDIHNAVIIDDKFMHALQAGENYDLIDPKSKKVKGSISAKAMWSKLIQLRMETGEPYMMFKDTVHRATPDAHKKLNLYCTTSNLCSEIMLPAGVDHLGKNRTSVCCLSSVNVEKWNEWKTDTQFIHDIMEFLDNVLQIFIDQAPQQYFSKATYAAYRERSVGLGIMGFHALLQSMNIPFESAVAKSMNMKIFKHLKLNTDKASDDLANERGPCPDALEAGVNERFIYKMAVAPTASISILCGGTSPCFEPFFTNAYTHKTKSGSFAVRNQYLEKTLEKYGMNTDDVWTTIKQQKGSAQHLNFLTEDERAMFKTSLEIDQKWLIEFAADRAPYIDQGQSINLFFNPDEKVATLSKLHFQAWKKGIKSLYYCRSISVVRAENSTFNFNVPVGGNILPDVNIITKGDDDDDLNGPDECLACQ